MLIKEFTIPIKPVTKKNSSQIIYVKGIPKIIPSKLYNQYEEDCQWFIPKLNINQPITLKAIFYMPTRRKVDLPNLQEALHDVLVNYGCLVDDNCNIIVSTDGSRVKYDKNNPRTEIFIYENDEEILSVSKIP